MIFNENESYLNAEKYIKYKNDNKSKNFLFWQNYRCNISRTNKMILEEWLEHLPPVLQIDC